MVQALFRKGCALAAGIAAASSFQVFLTTSASNVMVAPFRGSFSLQSSTAHPIRPQESNSSFGSSAPSRKLARIASCSRNGHARASCRTVAAGVHYKPARQSEHKNGMHCCGFPTLLGEGLSNSQSCSNFLASVVVEEKCQARRLRW